MPLPHNPTLPIRLGDVWLCRDTSVAHIISIRPHVAGRFISTPSDSLERYDMATLRSTLRWKDGTSFHDRDIPHPWDLVKLISCCEEK